MIENAIKSLLLGDQTVVSATSALTTQVASFAALLGALVAGRVYRVQLPRNSKVTIPNILPAIIIGRAETPRRLQNHDGPSGMTNARVEVHAVGQEGDSFTVAQVLAAARRLCDGWHGTAGSAENGGAAVQVNRIFVEGGKDIPNDPIGAEELALAQSMIELNCWFYEALA